MIFRHHTNWCNRTIWKLPWILWIFGSTTLYNVATTILRLCCCWCNLGWNKLLSIVFLVMKECFFAFDLNYKNTFQGIKTMKISKDPLLFLFFGFWWFIIKLMFELSWKNSENSWRQVEDPAKSYRIIWLEYANVIALRQEGFDMMKVVNLCNHCAKLILFFMMAPSFSKRWDWIEVIFFKQRCFETPST